jgi:hypothetical protein
VTNIKYFELSKKNSKSGKRKIKMALLEIHSKADDTNDNGLHWKKEYIMNNIDTAEGMPICCEFADETKSVPLGHGYTGIDSAENIPLFENSEVVGSISKAYPEFVEIEGKKKEVLIGEGWLYQQRYPEFVKWLSDNMEKGNVFSSIEITGKPENDNNIVYEEDEPLEDMRTAKEFAFSGTAILSVEPADKSAVILQLNNKTKESEKNIMDEKTINLIAETVRKTVEDILAENKKNEETSDTLNKTIEEKTNEISTLNDELAKVRTAIEELEKERDEWYVERQALEQKIGTLKAEQRLAEMDKAIENFTDEQKEYAKEEIEEFKKDPEKVEINSIVSKIYEEIGKKAFANKEYRSGIYSEVNDVTEKEAEKISDIYSDIY